MSTHAQFTDKDGDEYAVKYNPIRSHISIEGGDDDVIFNATDGQKIIDGIKSAMLEAALGGTYDAGVSLTDGGGA